jgi:hypothetical protein
MSGVNKNAIIREGYLEKKSPKSFMGYHPWQKRYFTLYFDRLVYKKSKKEDGDEDLGTPFILPIRPLPWFIMYLCAGQVPSCWTMSPMSCRPSRTTVFR